MKKLTIFPFTILIGFLVSLYSCNSSIPEKIEIKQLANLSSIVEKKLLFGLDLDEYDVEYDTIQKGWTWNHLFSAFDLSQYTINSTVERLKESPIELKYIVEGKPFVIFKAKEEKSDLHNHLVYLADPLSYILFAFKGDTVEVKKEERPMEIAEKVISGVIEQNSNLSMEINKHFESYAMTADLASSIEGVYAWSVDFFKLQVGDKFVIVYDEKSIEGKPHSVDKIKYAWFEHAKTGLYAFHFTDESGEVSGYYNELAEEMKRPFLMAPVQYTRISSNYNLGRYHPVLKVKKAHLGTDYAAPTGTPIYTTADGTVTAATSTSGNGLYVKVRHNQTYETQYLHMSKIADGMKPGVRVKQGDVIGYVGQTGLATGPHVCYRFWKNGKQIDPRSEKFQKSEPMKESVKPEYFEYVTPLKNNLDSHISTLQEEIVPSLASNS